MPIKLYLQRKAVESDLASRLEFANPYTLILLKAFKSIKTFPHLVPTSLKL